MKMNAYRKITVVCTSAFLALTACALSAAGDTDEASQPKVMRIVVQKKPHQSESVRFRFRLVDAGGTMAGLNVDWGDGMSSIADLTVGGCGADSSRGNPVTVKLSHRYKRGGSKLVTARAISVRCPLVEGAEPVTSPPKALRIRIKN